MARKKIDFAAAIAKRRATVAAKIAAGELLPNGKRPKKPEAVEIPLSAVPETMPVVKRPYTRRTPAPADSPQHVEALGELIVAVYAALQRRRQ